jgi:xanthine dehydrogenase YagR molybdenum-binding subunit
MPQEQKPQEPTANFTAKAGLPGSPQPLEVKPLATDIKPWDLDQLPKFEHMGKARSRTEGPLKVTGRAKYTYDVKLPGMLYGRMIGASVPAAEILSIDTSAAEALPGVKAVWTTDSRVVRFAGQDVAAVAAVSADVARDAARLVKVHYKERPFTHELREAMKPDAPRVFDMDRFPTGRDMGRSGNVGGALR